MTRTFGFAIATLCAAPAGAIAGMPSHPAVELAPAPSWVVPVEVEAEPTAGPGDAGVAVELLLVDFQARIDGSRTANYSRFVSRVRSPAGLGDVAEREINFDPAFQRLTLHRLTLNRDGSTSDRLDDAEITVLQRESDFARRIYDGSLSVLVVMPDVRVGDVVELSYTINGFNPVFAGRVFGGLSLNWWSPIERRHARLLHRSIEPLQWAVHGATEAGPAALRDGGWTERVWDLHAVPAYEADDRTPSDWEGSSWLQYTQYRSWAEVVAWAVKLYRVGDRAPEVRTAIAEATAGATSPTQRATAVTRWVQDELRYFAIVLGPNSHAPHEPAVTLRQRYGDCKDKSLLLARMLRGVGVDAWPALVSTDDGHLLPERLPSPGVFDHVIVYAELEGRPVWIDPTWSLQGGSFDATHVPDYGYALIVRPGETALTEIVGDQIRPGVISVDNHYAFDDDGSGCSVVITTEYQGGEADDVRYDLADSTVEDLQQRYIDFYSTSIGSVTPVGPLEVTDDRESNRVTIVERYRLDDWWAHDEEGRYFELLPVVLTDVLASVDLVERTAPLRIPRRVERHEVIRIEAPHDWQLDPVEVSIDEPWMRFRATSTSGTGSLAIVYELETGDAPVPIDRLADYNRSVEALQDATYYSILDGGTAWVSSSAVAALVVVVATALLLMAIVGAVLVRARLL